MATDEINPRYDRRVIEYYLRRGTVTREDYDQFLASLPDEADELKASEVRFDNPFERRAGGASDKR